MCVICECVSTHSGNRGSFSLCRRANVPECLSARQACHSCWPPTPWSSFCWQNPTHQTPLGSKHYLTCPYGGQGYIFSQNVWVTLEQNTCSEHMTRIHDTQSKKKKKVLVCENFTIIKLSKLVAYRVVDPCLMSNMDAKTPCHSFYFKQNNWTLIKTSWSSLPLIRYMVSHLLITFLWCKRCEWVCLHSCCTWNTPQRQRSLSVYHPG